MTSPKSDPFDLVGTTIAGKYDVEQVVAQTALSVVYRATHRVWQRSVAIKAFRAPMLSPEARQQMLASFVEEGRLLMDLSERCASICQARDVSSLTTKAGDWVPYTVLEWLDGECLEVLMRRERTDGLRPRTLAEAVALLNPIADALAIAHERGVVHRDVKPGNIFVLSDGRHGAPRTKLLDFGVAKVLRGSTAASATNAGAAVTQSFTPSYAAPEQFSPAYGTTGPWTDVFALALIVVELLAGREALEGEAVGALGMQSCDPDVRPTPRTLGVAVSEAVEGVLARALAVHLEDRFANARELWEALCGALASEATTDIEVAWEMPETSENVAGAPADLALVAAAETLDAPAQAHAETEGAAHAEADAEARRRQPAEAGGNAGDVRRRRDAPGRRHRRLPPHDRLYPSR